MSEDQDAERYAWRVTADVKAGEPGQGLVTINLTNALLGDVPPFVMLMDWKPGMEPQDVEAFALAILSKSFERLSEACGDLIREKLKP